MYILRIICGYCSPFSPHPVVPVSAASIEIRAGGVERDAYDGYLHCHDCNLPSSCCQRPEKEYRIGFGEHEWTGRSLLNVAIQLFICTDR